MKTSRTWIDRNLSVKQIDHLVDWLQQRTGNPSGSLIKEGILAILPKLEPSELPSHNSINQWRKKSYPVLRHIAQTKKDRELARSIARHPDNGDLADANRQLAEGILFDHILSAREKNGDIDLDALSTLIRGVSSLAKTQRDDQHLELRKSQWEQTTKEAVATAPSNSSITSEALQEAKAALDLM